MFYYEGAEDAGNCGDPWGDDSGVGLPGMAIGAVGVITDPTRGLILACNGLTTVPTPRLTLYKSVDILVARSRRILSRLGSRAVSGKAGPRPARISAN